ncbi:major facilitator superfamily domain-containing protein [Podospora didyma]|uniref:Major facilitator superfamily domain-containing protein n=1 Tax=Podospora didyma TaxID=330526 RepID=A0AAE0NQL2_9PEZI|nr:major facilitator superfamily domain-containing protein [Podospora didyma]
MCCSWRGQGFWRRPERDVRNVDPGPQRASALVRKLDRESFNWRVFSVSASGFLASSYSLFATNVIKPALYFVYPPCGRLGQDAGLVIDQVTLVGTATGMLLAGHFADLWGRKKLYGLELAILLVATAGVMQTSEGFLIENPDGTYRHSIDFYAAITWWRFFLGIGIGAEYPLTAVIAAEWSSTKSRGRMLAGVYAMQAVARFLAPIIGLAALRIAGARSGLGPDSPDDDLSRLVIDLVWRVVTGIAMVPAAFAVVLRLTIPETPRYHADIRKDTIKAMRNYLRLYKRRPQPSDQIEAEPEPEPAADGIGREKRFLYGGAWKYLCKTRAGKDLAVISLLWLIMDVAWYGLSMESPSALSTLWHDPSRPIPTTAALSPASGLESLIEACPDSDDWQTDPGRPSIYRVLENNAVRSLLVVSIGSILGNLALVFVIDRFRRRWILMTSFVMLAFLFALTGGTLLGTVERQQPHLVTTVFFGIMHFFFTIGPKTVILVLAVELFPTVYRGTFYGVSACVGKFGAILIRGIIAQTKNGEHELAKRLLGFVPLMLFAALVSWFLPEVQHIPPIPGAGSRVDIEDGNLSDGATSGSEADERRQVRPRAAGWRAIIQKLENKTLEEIPPSTQLPLEFEGNSSDEPMAEVGTRPAESAGLVASPPKSPRSYIEYRTRALPLRLNPNGAVPQSPYSIVTFGKG